MEAKVGELLQEQDARVAGGLFMLENPSVGVRDKDSVQARRNGGIDVRARAVADHPCSLWMPAGLIAELLVGPSGFFRQDLHTLELTRQARPPHLATLLVGISLGYQIEQV